MLKMAARAGIIILSEAQIKNLIPHREPFLFVRHAIQNEIGKSITTVARMTPGIMLSTQMQMMEGLGQTSALLLRQMPKYQHHRLPVFAAMRHVTWEAEPENFHRLLFTAEMKRAASARFGTINAYAQLDGKNICSGELVFSFLR